MIVIDIMGILEIFNKKGVTAVTPKDPIMASIFPEWLGNGEQKLTDPYSQLSIIFAAIKVKAQNISQIPFKIYPKGSDKEILSGPIFDLYNNANPNMSRFDLWAAQVTQLDMHGDCPVLKDEDENRGVPIALWPVDSKTVKEVITNSGAFVGYNVKVGNQELFYTKDRVIMPKYYNPKSMIRGMSPLTALELDMSAEWAAMRYNQVFFENGQTPGAIFSTDQQLSQVQHEHLQQILVKNRQGVNQSHKSMVLYGGLKLASARPTNKDMEFLDMRKFNLDRFLAVLGVPKKELQMYDDVNYATAKSVDISFWEKTLIPTMRLLQEKHNSDFLNSLGYQGKFDLSSIDVLNERISEKADTALKYWSMGVPFAEINRRFNLGFDNIPGADLSKFELEPVRTVEQPTKSKTLVFPTVGDLEPQKIDISNNKDLREAKWKSLVNKIKVQQGEIKQIVKKYFFTIEQKIYKRIAKDFKDAVNKAAADLSESDFLWIDDLFSDQGLKNELIGVYTKTATAAGISQLSKTEILNIVNYRLDKVTGINATARAEILDELKKVLQQTLEDGLTESARADAIINSVKGRFDILKRRAITIARTEAHAVYENARFEDLSKTEPPYKMWLDSRDKNVRMEHTIDGEVVKWDETFSNGLLYPHDPAGDAANVINCRCTFVALYDLEQVAEYDGRPS